MRKFTKVTAGLVLTLLCSGCGFGLIYTHTVEPLNPSMKHRAERTSTSGQGDIKQIAIDGISVTWDDSSLGSIAKAKGITEIYYADREILFVMFGIWTQQTIHVYGR